MLTFFAAVTLLILGYFIYGKFIEKVFKPKSDKPTPAYVKGDVVDFVPMNKTKNSFIQVLNIAGVGPIFGPILGALYGPIAFLWIVVGAIFAGAVHDYLTGMISIRNGGAHLPELASKFLGKPFSHVVNFFTVLLLLLVGTVFISAPASMINGLMENKADYLTIITLAIFGYYIISTVLPIDKIIGKIYPVLGFLLLVSALGIGIAMFFSENPIPELTIANLHPNSLPYYPVIFLTISCGALSGFHATQSPIISRTVKNEKDGRTIFYGMMIVEGVIAMVWAAAAMTLVGGDGLNGILENGGAPQVVNEVATVFLGSIFGTIAIIGIIVLPITSGDTSFRAARMIIADYLKVGQISLKNRFVIAIPLFVLAFILTKLDFQVLWRYFSWANQGIAAIALWIATVYLYQRKAQYIVSLAPAIFITSVLGSYLFFDPTIGFGFDIMISNIIGSVIAVLITILFFVVMRRNETPAEVEFNYDK